MAIREVLISNTFEQQRQMINLIGTDVGDCATLVTPSKVVSTSINQVVAGFVTLSGQTIQLEDGALGTPSLSFDSTTNLGLYKVDSNTLGVTKNLYVASGLTVEGDITFRAGNGSSGSIVFGDLDTDNIVFNADLNSHVIPNIDNTYDLGTSLKEWRNLYIDGTAQVDTLQVDENARIAGTLTSDTGTISVSSGVTTVDFFDDYATTVEAFGAGTNIRIGATTGTLTLRNPIVEGTQASQFLFDDVATTVYAFGNASEIFMGITLSGVPGNNSNFTIRSDDTILVGDLNVNGGEILSSQNTFDLLINNTDIRIGASTGTGTTVINNSLSVKGNTFDLSNQGVTVLVKDNLNPALRFREGTNDYLSFQTTNTLEKVILHKPTYFLDSTYYAPNPVRAYFGTLNELSIFSAGSTNGTSFNYIDATSGYLDIRNLKTTIRNPETTTQRNLAVFDSTTFNAEFVKLYYGGNERLETTSAGITVTGNITASGLTLSGDLIVNGTTTTINSTVLSIDDVNIVLADGNTTDAGANGGGITLKASSDKTLTYNSTTNRWATNIGLTVGGLTEVQQITEVLNTKTSATGTVTHDYSTGAIWYHSSISANFTLNLTNVPTTNDRVITITLVLNQGGTGYYPNALQIDGAAQTIRWLNNATPTPSTNKFDTVSFSLVRTGSSWYVLGQLTAYN